MSHFATLNLTDEAKTEVEVEYTATGGDPGNTYGLPEDCWPSEAPEIEIVAVYRKADGDKITISDADLVHICTHLAEIHVVDYSDPYDFED